MPLQDTDNLVIAREGVNYKMAADELKDYIPGSAEIGTGAPAEPFPGMLWWNTTTGRLNVYNGTAWVDASPAPDAVVTVFPGMVMYHTSTVVPTGWLKANGAEISRSVYSALFAVIGTHYGAGNGSTTFNLPDLRGEFIRCLAEGHPTDYTDPWRGIGTFQDQSYLSHNHAVGDPGHAHGVYDPGHAHVYNRTDPSANGGVNLGFQFFALTGLSQHGVGTSASGTGIAIYGAGTGVSIAANGGAETRPRNKALLAIIKY